MHDVGNSGIFGTSIRILADVASVDEASITPSTRLRDELDLDSIDLLEVAQRIEDELGLVLTDDDLSSAGIFETAGTLVQQLEKRRLDEH